MAFVIIAITGIKGGKTLIMSKQKMNWFQYLIVQGQKKESTIVLFHTAVEGIALTLFICAKQNIILIPLLSLLITFL